MSYYVNEWSPLDKIRGEWVLRTKKTPKGKVVPVRLKTPTNRPCLFDDGNSQMRFALDGNVVYARNIMCDGDRIHFMKKVSHLCDAYLLS